MKGDLISRQKLLDAYDAQHKGTPGGARKLIEEAPDETEPKEQRFFIVPAMAWEISQGICNQIEIDNEMPEIKPMLNLGDTIKFYPIPSATNTILAINDIRKDFPVGMGPFEVTKIIQEKGKTTVVFRSKCASLRERTDEILREMEQIRFMRGEGESET